MLRKFVLRFAPSLVYPCLVWWVWWSKIYRLLFHSRYKNVSVYTLPTHTVLRTLSKLKWTADGLPELWDSCGSPNWVQFCVEQIAVTGRQPDGALDCDDFSVWAAHCMSPIYKPRLLTVIWVGKDRMVQGHVMCLCTNQDGRLFHIGNWGHRGFFADLEELCRDLIVLTGEGPIIGWAVLSKDLQISQHGKGAPEANNDGSLR